MSFAWDDDRQEQSQAMWAEFLAQIPSEFNGDPEKFLEAYNTVLAKERDLKVYRDFYHNEYLPWQRGFDFKSYEEYVQSRDQAHAPQGQRPDPVPPTLAPSLLPGTRGTDDDTWDVADLSEFGDDE
jgi:hypothetical protein